MKEYIGHLQKVLMDERVLINDIIISHWHHDHVGGVDDILEVIDNKGNRGPGPSTSVSMNHSTYKSTIIYRYMQRLEISSHGCSRTGGKACYAEGAERRTNIHDRGCNAEGDPHTGPHDGSCCAGAAGGQLAI